MGDSIPDRGSDGTFCFRQRLQTDSGAHPASYAMDIVGCYPWVKRPVRDADHSPPSSTEVTNTWRIPPLHQYVFVVWCLVKHRNNFTFTFMKRKHLGVVCTRIVVHLFVLVTFCIDEINTMLNLLAVCVLS